MSPHTLVTAAGLSLPGEQPPVQDPNPFAPPPPVDEPVIPHPPHHQPGDAPAPEPAP